MRVADQTPDPVGALLPPMSGRQLAGWDRVASVRTKPRRLLGAPDEFDKVYFSPDLMPVVHHPQVAGLGEEVVREILVRRLYHYLDVTTWIEQSLVNEGLVRLFQGRALIRLPAELEFDAYTIYCDEGYHALFSVDLKCQVAEATGILGAATGRPRVLCRLDELQRSVSVEARELAHLFFVAVYETLISSILARVPRDRRVVEPVRRVIQDHAEDEGRHHAYFSKVFRLVWSNLVPEQRDEIGPLLPAAIHAALEPDYAAVDAILASVGLGPDERRRIVAESYPAAVVLQDIQRAAAATIHLIRRTGGFEHAPTREALRAYGLVSA